MAQGGAKARLGKGKSANMRRQKVMKQKAPKKGGRTIKPTNKRAIAAQRTDMLLTRKISHSIERTMVAKSGTVIPMRMLKAIPNSDKKPNKMATGKVRAGMSMKAASLSSDLSTRLTNSRQAKSVKAFKGSETDVNP